MSRSIQPAFAKRAGGPRSRAESKRREFQLHWPEPID